MRQISAGDDHQRNLVTVPLGRWRVLLARTKAPFHMQEVTGDFIFLYPTMNRLFIGSIYAENPSSASIHSSRLVSADRQASKHYQGADHRTERAPANTVKAYPLAYSPFGGRMAIRSLSACIRVPQGPLRRVISSKILRPAPRKGERGTGALCFPPWQGNA